VCAWFVLAIRQAHDTSKASSIVSGTGSLTAAQAAHAGSLLDAAGTLNPDREVELLRGQVLLGRQQRPRALRLLEGVTRDEPLNLRAWVLLAESAFGNGPVIARAEHELATLDPLGTRARR
jgi:predicted Zn-dependent protease